MDRKNHQNQNIAKKQTVFLEKKIVLFLLIAILLALAGILAFLGEKTLSIGELLRPEVGEAAKEVELTVRFEDSEEAWDWKGSIAARIYSAKELEENMEKAGNYIRQHLAEEGESLEKVTSKLNLVEKVPETGVSVTWSWNRQDLLDRDGRVLQENLSEETPLILTAELRCQKLVEQIQIPVLLVPEVLSDVEKARRELELELAERIGREEEGSFVKLPEQWGGKAVFFTKETKGNLWILPLLGAFLFLLLPFRRQQEQKKEKQERREELLQQYPDFVGSFTILLGAGMNLFSVWKKLAEEYQVRLERGGKREALYEEVRITVQELQNGELERKAYEEFGRRIGLVPYRRFSSILGQNLKLGADQVMEQLDYEVSQALENRKAGARERGEEIGTKLLLPMALQLLLILLIIMVPAFLSL